MVVQKLDISTMLPVNDVRRYSLRREVDQTTTDGERRKRYQMSAGGIDLCTPCWTRICAPRMNPKKANNRHAWKEAS